MSTIAEKGCIGERRNKIAAEMACNSVLVMFAGGAPVKSADEEYEFAPSRNYYYLTGLNQPNGIFMLQKRYDIGKQEDVISETLFIERSDELYAKWMGELLKPDEATALSGIKQIKYIDEFYKVIAGMLFSGGTETVYIDLERRSWDSLPTPAETFAAELAGKYPHIAIKSIYPAIAGLRMIKSDDEVSLIRRAIDITKSGIASMMINIAPGMYEYEAEAYFNFELQRLGVKETAFKTIAASGINATVLHYSSNDCVMNDGDLFLCDLGASCGYYAADITRTFPVNGKFTERQAQIYNIVLSGQQLVIDMIKPGVRYKALNEELRKYYCRALNEIGLLTEKMEKTEKTDEKLDAGLSEYYYHGVSHSLGLDTHDIGRFGDIVLMPGMVITVEPGLYIKDEELGIRIEDDVLVTETGCEVLSKDIIKTVADIEAFMLTHNNTAAHGDTEHDDTTRNDTRA